MGFNDCIRDSQGLRGVNPKILAHCHVRWNFFVRYGLSKTDMTSSVRGRDHLFVVNKGPILLARVWSVSFTWTAMIHITIPPFFSDIFFKGSQGVFWPRQEMNDFTLINRYFIIIGYAKDPLIDHFLVLNMNRDCDEPCENDRL